MDCLRLTKHQGRKTKPCCRCGNAQRNWDRLAGKAICPNCQETLVVGEGDPLVLRIEPKLCAACGHEGTVRFLTFPRNQAKALEMDLCAVHLRGLWGRCLNQQAYYELCRQIQELGIDATEVFLLHDAFYDDQGRPLQPAFDEE